MRGDGGRFMTPPPSRLEARGRLGEQAASELGVLQSLLPFPDSCQGTSPHQQGRDPKMIEHCYGGIDVSQERLDVMVLPQGKGFSVANDKAGWSRLALTRSRRATRDSRRSRARFAIRHRLC